MFDNMMREEKVLYLVITFFVIFIIIFVGFTSQNTYSGEYKAEIIGKTYLEGSTNIGTTVDTNGNVGIVTISNSDKYYFIIKIGENIYKMKVTEKEFLENYEKEYILVDCYYYYNVKETKCEIKK